MLEVHRLQAIVEYLDQALKEATEMWRAAIARAEGTPLLDGIDKEGR